MDEEKSIWERRQKAMKECEHPKENRISHPNEDIRWHCTKCGYIEKREDTDG